MSKSLIVGLGNIGDEYAHTRHNIGFDVLDYLAKENDVKFKTDKLADVAELKYKGKQLVLIHIESFFYYLQQFVFLLLQPNVKTSILINYMCV